MDRKPINTAVLRDYADHACFIDADARGHLVQCAETIELMTDALLAARGYLLNAKIDLETDAPKWTAIGTIEGGLKVVDAALAQARGGTVKEPKEDTTTKGRQHHGAA